MKYVNYQKSLIKGSLVEVINYTCFICTFLKKKQPLSEVVKQNCTAYLFVVRVFGTNGNLS